MNALIRTFALALLFFNGLTACFGGLMLILKPDGSGLGMPLSLLESTPFNNYLIPGVALFISNGLSSLLIAALTIRQHLKAPILIMTQGCILLVWIISQMIMLQQIIYLHVISIIVAMLLIVSGWRMTKRNIVT